MNDDIERRLVDAMAARAGEVEPQDEIEAIDNITQRVGNMNRNRAFALAGVAAAIFVVVGAIALLNRDDNSKQNVNVAGQTSTSTSTSTTTTTTASSAYPADAIWPFDSSRSFDSPGAAALSFAVEYLGMTNAQVDSATGTQVVILANSRASVRMVVQLEETPRGWFVTGAKSDDIVVDSPKPHDKLQSSLTLDGTSVAFEAQIGVELRPVGATNAIASSFVMGGGTEMLPFHGSIDVPATNQPLVLILFEADQSGEQTYVTASVVFLDAA